MSVAPVSHSQGIGQAVPRVQARRLVTGSARYLDDIQLPGLLHAAFYRSPYAHARFRVQGLERARAMSGVFWVATWDDLQNLVHPFVGVLHHLKGMVSPPQWPLAPGVARWQGEPLVMVVASSRALAEDALEVLELDFEPLPPVTDARQALAPGHPLIHEELPSGNLAYECQVIAGDWEQVQAACAHRLNWTMKSERVTSVTLEPRGILADWDEGRGEITVHAGTQVAHMMQSVVAELLGLALNRVRVVATETGGSFGLKIQTYPDEMAVIAASRHLRRPVKFVADRLEAFATDVHARGHDVELMLCADQQGVVQGFSVQGWVGIGPYQMHPRGSVNEVRHVVNLLGAPYRAQAHRAHYQVAFQNKAPYGMYRGVGHPLACLYTEVGMDLMARQMGMDPVAFRRRNFRPDAQQAHVLASGVSIEALSHAACLDAWLQQVDYAQLRQQQADARAQGRYLGLGLAVFVENSNHGSGTYGKGGAPIAATDGCHARMLPDGTVWVTSGACDTGQGAETALTQIVAHALDVPLTQVRVQCGDTASAPISGGNWGSRGTGIAGEAAWQTALALKQQLLLAAASLWRVDVAALTFEGGVFRPSGQAEPLGTLADLSRSAYMRPDLFQPGFIPQLAATVHYAQRDHDGGIYTNGLQACWLEVDVQTGSVRVLKHWVVDDCGVVINPALADEQLRGAVVQGLGQALQEACYHDSQGQLLNASLSDYAVPLSSETPDIETLHVCTPTRSSELGAKGVAEAGVTGAIAAVLNAVNDALSPFEQPILQIPITPNRILQAIGAISPQSES
jgi:carbon-monoxide dehydrogenase large subunit